MTGEATFGREPLQVVVIQQPRCNLTFGTAPCTATLGDGPKCYQTWGTCLDRAHINQSQAFEWVFVKPDALSADGAPFLTRSVTGSTFFRTDPIPSLVSVSHSPSRLNVGAAKDSESPFGIRSGVTIQFSDIIWDDRAGDSYLSERTPRESGFWQRWTARNPFYANMLIMVYEGYKGQTLAEMQVRRYVLDSVKGPDSNGKVSITGIDPLRLSDPKRTKFPRATEMRLRDAINNSQTTGIVIVASAADIGGDFGNTGIYRSLRIGSEILQYTGYTGSGEYTLTGVTRAYRGTTAAAAEAGVAAQRTGEYYQMNCWDVVYDLLTSHTDLPASYINKTAWDAEASTFLTGFDISAVIHEPTSVEKLCGEIMQQCSFYIWWDERLATIPLKAVRPERSRRTINDESNIIAGSASLTRDVEAWFTQLYIYFGQKDPTKGFDATNFKYCRVLINSDLEAPAAADTVRQKVVFSRWLRTESQTTETSVRLLGRFANMPRYLSLTVDAKDREIAIGDVITVVSSVSVNSEGLAKDEVWQVISADEIEAGHAVRYDLQEFQFLAARYGKYMADSAPTFAAATDEEKFVGAWYADDDGNMPDGSDPYMYQ